MSRPITLNVISNHIIKIKTMEQNEQLKKDEVSPIVKDYIENKKKEKENANQNPDMEGVSEAMKLYIQSKNKK